MRQAPKVRKVSSADLGCGHVSAEQAIQAAAASARTPQQKPAPASRGDELDLHFEPGELEALFEESGLGSLNYTVDDSVDDGHYVQRGASIAGDDARCASSTALHFVRCCAEG